MKKIIVVLVSIVLLLTFLKVKASTNWTNGKLLDACPEGITIVVEEMVEHPLEELGGITGFIWVDDIYYELIWDGRSFNPTYLNTSVPIQSKEINFGFVSGINEPHYSVPIPRQNFRCDLIYFPSLFSK